MSLDMELVRDFCEYNNERITEILGFVHHPIL
jgi:hypothetical protein